MSSEKYDQSRNLIGMASNHMTDYRLSEKDANEVGISVSDTGVIILIILYFIDKEPSISSTKLEYYIILLDMKCLENRGVTLFNWKLKGKHINKFRNIIIQHMIKKELISFKGRHSYQITSKGNKVSQIFAMLSNIRHLLDDILSECGALTAKDMETVVIGIKHNSSYVEALKKRLIGIRR